MAQRIRVPRPARNILIGFVITLLIGAALLTLPASTVDDGGLRWLPALFTATSALCVTGLTTVDTATHWSPFGHVVILVLIQLGGFGVMSFATILGYSITHRLSLGSRLTTAAETHGPFGGVQAMLLRVLRTSLAIEATVMLALTARFAALGHPLDESAWYGLFHAVSSFNNAGFSLFAGNMVPFVGDWFVCVPIMAAIVLGGLGFPVLHQLATEFRLPRRWSMNTRLVLLGTSVLLLFSSLYVILLEWHNPRTLGPLPADEKILAGTFQAVQTRTAGFNSVDIGALHDETRFGMDLWMFIGGSPAGTAGGVKVTTVLVLVFIAWSEIRGRDAVNVLGKRLARSVQREAFTVLLLAFGLIVVASTLLLIITDHSLDAVLFEALSAFGTVGLSTGITPGLDGVSQGVLITLMMLGRLGPITVATALAAPAAKRVTKLPRERPIIG